MAYNRRVLWEHIHTMLKAQPGISLAELSNQLRVERHTIERVILEIAGRTFRDLQSEFRQRAAEEYLRGHPELSVKQIAAVLGFESPRVFSRFFRAGTGQTPSEYRAQLTKAAGSR